jgi:hypothetical protein
MWNVRPYDLDGRRDGKQMPPSFRCVRLWSADADTHEASLFPEAVVVVRAQGARERAFGIRLELRRARLLSGRSGVEPTPETRYAQSADGGQVVYQASPTSTTAETSARNPRDG